MKRKLLGSPLFFPSKFWQHEEGKGRRDNEGASQAFISLSLSFEKVLIKLAVF